LRFPADVDVIITDTVGFIQNLPKDLMVAFRATLEELKHADLLLHIIDISNPRHHEQVQSVEYILSDLKLNHIPQVRGLNKIDMLSQETVSQCTERLRGIPICAKNQKTLVPLIQEMAAVVEKMPQIHF
jgi:GTP-binding protein HflX